MSVKTYDLADVTLAANDGANLVTNDRGIRTNARDNDLINLVVNAILTKLESPDATLDQVIEENYGTDAEDVRSWF